MLKPTRISTKNIGTTFYKQSTLLSSQTTSPSGTNTALSDDHSRGLARTTLPAVPRRVNLTFPPRSLRRHPSETEASESHNISVYTLQISDASRQSERKRNLWKPLPGLGPGRRGNSHYFTYVNGPSQLEGP